MNKILLYFGRVMVFMYIAGGIHIILFGVEIFSIPSWGRIMLGFILIAYGVFRFFRYKALQE